MVYTFLMQSWKIFAVLYTLGITGYALAAKFSGGKISPLFGAMLMTACSLSIITCFFLWYRVHGGEFTYTRYGVAAAALAGISIALADIALFFMYARGAQLSVAALLTEVISIAVVTLIGLLLLKEPFSWTKGLGILFSAIGILLLFEG
ncbi:EamA family transporter [Candidatus Kaiserbacteria bacterium]|nr:EamA family transporter [Candidatus Kaiserbacteria bacterium]